MPTEDENLRCRMHTLAVYEEDLVEKFILGSGSGGQKINKTASCVYLKHVPSGIEVKCQRSRSRDKNRNLARQELCQRLEDAEAKRTQLKKAARARRRVQARGRSRSTKRKMLEKKRQRGETKRLRAPVRD